MHDFIVQVHQVYRNNRAANSLIDDIVYYDIVIQYENLLFYDIGVGPSASSSGIGWRSRDGGGRTADTIFHNYIERLGLGSISPNLHRCSRLPLRCAIRCADSPQPLANHKNITRPSHCFGCIFSHVRTRPVAEDVWKISCMRIRNCWKRIFHSLIIRPGGFSVTKHELHGWNRI
jgi:hypothetical protein